MTTTVREQALEALSELKTFVFASPVDQEDMVVHLVVALNGKSADMDRLVRRDRAEALELASLAGDRVRRIFTN